MTSTELNTLKAMATKSETELNTLKAMVANNKTELSELKAMVAKVMENQVDNENAITLLSIYVHISK